MMAKATLAVSLVGVAMQLLILWLILRGQKKQAATPKDVVARQYVLDTSAIMDNRLSVLLQSSILTPLLTTDAVLRELQLLADKGHAEKRSRGQASLRYVAELKEKYDLSVVATSNYQDQVDEQLLQFCSDHSYCLVTADHALALRARAQSVLVCDIAQLSGSLRTPYAPGDHLTLHLDKLGDLAGQAVGYLTDGTMVVVQDGASRVGQTASVVVQKSTQKDSGRILFAELV